ncbi:MAG: pyrimidine reductase [Anaerolineales bacterium]|nr:dihydrofolate reductase [Anaerolineae bacterium]PWB69022.1 MAG: pyrimidine reductase [Anaerolineales bacterium]
MRELIVREFITLDGVIESPETWQFPYLSEDVAEQIQKDVHSAESMLLGRATYEIFAASWPLRTRNEFGVADKLNSEPKYIVTSSLDTVMWNNSRLIKGNIEMEIRKLKQQPGGAIQIVGSAMLVQTLMNICLIDELQLMVHPVVVGHGKRLFDDGITSSGLNLIEAKTFSSGVVLLRYKLEAARTTV